MRIAPTKLLNVGAAIIFAGTLVVSANSPISARNAHAKMQTIRMGYLENNPVWVPTLDPAEVTDQNSSWLTQLMNGGLVNLRTVNGKIQLYNDLAARHTVSKNGKVYKFYLRKNAKFADGHRVTAADVVFSIRRALSPAAASTVNAYDNLITGFDNYVAGKSNSLGVKAVNKSTVQINISHRAGYFLYAFTYPLNFIVEKRVLNGKKLDSGGSYITTTCKANVGAGPFTPVCNNGSANDKTSFYSSGSTPTLTLKPNKYFYGPKPKFKMVIPAIDSNQTGYQDFLSGGLDVTWGIPSTDQARWRGKKGAFDYAQSGIEWLAPNLHQKPFNNIHCRLAVDYAIDRKTLTKTVQHGAYKPLYTVVPPGFLGFYNGKGTPHYNPKKARQELAKCPGGINTTYTFRNDTADRIRLAGALEAMMARVGIHFKLQGEPRADWLKVILNPLSKTNTTIAYDDWFMDYPDPQDYLDVLLHSGRPQNCQGWNNKRYDALVDRANASTNQKTRAKLYIEAQKLALGQAAFIPVDNFSEFDLVSTKVKGMAPSLNNGVIWAKNGNWSLVHK